MVVSTSVGLQIHFEKACSLPPVVGHALQRGARHVHGDHLALAALALVLGKLPRELLVVSGLKHHNSHSH